MIGKEQPRIWTRPLTKLTAKTSLGFAAIEYAETVLGMSLYPWQKWALIHALEITGDLKKRDGWRFRFRTVFFMVSRQNGKTELSKVIASFFLNVLRVENVFGTSLSMEKAEEVWEAVIQDQETHAALAREIQTVARRNGGKKLVLTGLRTYKAVNRSSFLNTLTEGYYSLRCAKGYCLDYVMTAFCCIGNHIKAQLFINISSKYGSL